MQSIKLFYNNKCYDVLLAKTPDEIYSGMSIYSEPPDHGMLFILNNSKYISMEDMNYPLFVSFFDSSFTELYKNIYYPGDIDEMPKNTSYMLELPLHII